MRLGFMWIKILVLLLSLALCADCLAAQLDLPTDASGWTVFTPSDDSRICYVDPVGGNDGTAQYYDDDDAAVGANPFEPTGTINAYATYLAAYNATRAGYPDWILFKRGTTLTATDLLASENLGHIKPRDGRDSNEPSLLGAYGTTGASPIIQIPTTGLAAIYRLNDGMIWAAISGIDFYAYQRDPENAGYTGNGDLFGIYQYINGTDTLTQGFLVEGCKFRFFHNVYMTVIATREEFQELTFRRNMFLNSYAADGSRAQGLNLMWTSGTVEENIFYHCGWLTTGDQGNHNTYFTNFKDLNFNKNISILPSNNGFKFVCEETGLCSGFVLDDNLIVDAEYSVSICTNDAHVDLRLVSPTVTDNVITQMGRTNTHANKFWGFDLAGWNGGVWANNIMMNQENSGKSNGFGLQITDNTVNVSITNNIFYNIMNADGAIICGDQTTNSNEQDTYYVKSGITITGNKFQIPSYSEYLVNGLTTISGFAFSGNTYYSDDATDLARVNTTDYNLSGWQTLEEPDAVWQQVSFSAPTRDVDTYMASIGGTATVDGFIAAQRAQDRYSWDSRLEADTVNDWIRAGFDLNEYGTPIQHRSGGSPSGGSWSGQ